MKKLLLIFFVFLSAHYTGYSQEKMSSVKAMITDSITRETIEQASVTLIRVSDSVIVRQVLSGSKGFEIRRVGKGEYMLTISHVEYQPDTLMIQITRTDTVYNLGRIHLLKSSASLVEVIVRAVIPPVMVRDDTLIFNANAYKTQPNATVEDLLKKLPGMVIDKEGNVTFQGKKVEKIYIDGKEFFLNDPRQATQNLTADMVDAVEAFENQSERARFIGIKDFNANKAINLRLKKDRKKGLFGNTTASAGTQKRYTAAGAATFFKGDFWSFGNLNFNYADNFSNGAGQMRSGNNRTINLRNNLGSKTVAVVNYSGSSNKTKSGQSYLRETFLRDSSLLQTRNALNENISGSHNFSSNITYNIDSFNSINYTPSFSIQDNGSISSDSTSISLRKQTASYLSNTGRTINNITGKGKNLNNNISFRRRFKNRGRTLTTSLAQGFRSQGQDGKLFSSLQFYNDSGFQHQNKTVDQQYTQHTLSNNYGLNIGYTEPVKAGQILDIGYSLNTSSSISDRKALNYDSATARYSLTDTLTSNKFYNNNTNQNINLGYNFLGTSAQYQVGLSFIYTSMNNRSDNKYRSDIEQQVMNWAPRAAAMFNLKKQRNMEVQYNGSSSTPTTEMLQPIPDLTNPFLIRIGNPDLKQQFHHGLNLNYNAANSKNFTNVSININGDYTANKIVQSSVITSGIQQLQYINVEDGTYGLNGDINYGFPLNKNRNGSGQLSTTINYGKDENRVNGEQNIIRSITLSQNASVNYHTTEKLFAGVSASINYSRFNYSIAKEWNTEAFSQNYTANITLVLPLGIRFNSDYSINIIGRQGSLPGRTIETLNASVYSSLFKSNKGEIRFSGINLLDQNTSFNRTAAQNYIETRQVNIIRRYFTVSLRYNFRANK